MRFTTSKETGYPYADIIGLIIKSITVIVEKSDEMLFQFFCYNVLVQFLDENTLCFLLYLYDSIDLSVDVVLKHLLNSHYSFSSIPTTLNAL